MDLPNVVCIRDEVPACSIRTAGLKARSALPSKHQEEEGNYRRPCEDLRHGNGVEAEPVRLRMACPASFLLCSAH